MITDSRVARIRSLITEANTLAVAIADELDAPWNPDFRNLRTLNNYLRRAIAKTHHLEAS